MKETKIECVYFLQSLMNPTDILFGMVTWQRPITWNNAWAKTETWLLNKYLGT